MPLLTYIINRHAQWAHNTALIKIPPLTLKTQSFEDTCFGFLSSGATRWNDQCWGCRTAKSLQLALIVVIPVIVQEQSSQYLSFPELQTIQLFLSLWTTCPPALSLLQSAAQPSSAQNIFFNQHPIVGFSPMSRGDISQAGAFPPPYPPSLALILPLHPSLWKEGVWHWGYQLPARSQPRPKAQTSDIPTALNTKNTKLRGKKP